MSVRVFHFVGFSTTHVRNSAALSLCCRNRSDNLCFVVFFPAGISGWRPLWGPGDFSQLSAERFICSSWSVWQQQVPCSKTPTLLLLLIWTCKFWAVSSSIPGQSSVYPCCHQTELPPSPWMVLPEEPLSTHGSAPVDALLQPRCYACVNTNMLLNNWVIPRIKAP